MRHSLQKLVAIGLLTVSGIFQFSASVPDEGMYPLSDIHLAGLKKAGLKINEQEIYSPGKVSLVDALVRVSGCSGSFVSPNGLIITNHHCAFSAVQLASSPESNYLENGFVANSLEQEIQAEGLTIRITESYEDVSEEVLAAVEHINDPIDRIEIINEKRKEIARRAVEADPSITAEVSEMFIGKSYVLFKYKTIEDVRLVYVPRQDIGEFGGDLDNWVWPRHTGDFAFLRAYVAPDGSSAKYSPDNIPFTPKRHLKVNPNGVEEDDFVFILGYPGRTFRHRPAQYLEYQEKFLLPYTSDLYNYQNEQMSLASQEDKAIELQLATRIKRNANVMKNYQGKMKGLRSIDLVATKYQEDKELENYIQSNKKLQAEYGSLMKDINSHYQEVMESAPKEMWMNNIYGGSNILRVARQLWGFKDALASQSADRQQLVFDKNIAKVKETVQEIYKDYNKQVDINILTHMFEQALALKGTSNAIRAVSMIDAENAEDGRWIIEQTVNASRLSDPDYVLNNLLSSVEDFIHYNDDLMDFQQSLLAESQAFYSVMKRREGELNKLMADYVAVKEQFLEKNFVPDANSTLRLTYGNIKGYTPVDATYMSPITTIKGIIEKGYEGKAEYQYPESIRRAWEAKDFGKYTGKKRNDVPVNILYNMDTTGGNSGSPIMNAYGELIGVNFDRAYEATINDFAWNESYSRSIGVDIRYVLWVADKIDGAHFILDEMGI
ncbi:MAG TPA: S46 family peptidase [Candidatus Sphingobacterium stercoripullorum]|nr:S46 family peptidase [Candidatus Sphingobacterium stercoripullorum]